MLLTIDFDRILVTDMKEFAHESKFVKKHIPCKYHKEMSCQSEVVRRYLGRVFKKVFLALLGTLRGSTAK